MRWWHEHGRESRVASREARGRGFKDHSTDLVKKGCSKFSGAVFHCKYKDEKIDVYISDDFPVMVERKLGNYSNAGVSKINSALEKQYVSIASPNLEETEKFTFQSGKTSELNWYYENKKDRNKPNYLVFSAYIGKQLKCGMNFKNCYFA